jgi:hypothetical protein
MTPMSDPNIQDHRELSRQIARRVLGWTPRPDLGRDLYEIPDRQPNDELRGPLRFLVYIGEASDMTPSRLLGQTTALPAREVQWAFAAAEAIHQMMHERQNDPAAPGYAPEPWLNYLLLTRVGMSDAEPWAATFDPDPGIEWYEPDRITSSPLTSRGATPAEAICRACLRVADALGLE